MGLRTEVGSGGKLADAGTDRLGIGDPLAETAAVIDSATLMDGMGVTGSEGLFISVGDGSGVGEGTGWPEGEAEGETVGETEGVRVLLFEGVIMGIQVSGLLRT